MIGAALVDVTVPVPDEVVEEPPSVEEVGSGLPPEPPVVDGGPLL